MTPVNTQSIGTVLLITIDNPPINASSHAVRAGLTAAIDELARRPDLAAAVLIGGGSTFIAGADIREFGQPAQDPSLPAVIEAIEACPKPVVAALHGAALGGGLEVALACDARIALQGTSLGLPEVTLGVVPGAGGTQRLPRRVGLVRAIDMIGRGERIRAEEALGLRLLDAVVPADLQAHAVALASRMDGLKRRIRDEAVPPADADLVERTAQEVARAGKERPAVVAAIDLVRDAARLPFDAALAKERTRFLELRDSTEAAALRHQFFAEREAVRLPSGLDAAPRPVQTIAVIGAGTMGSGIAIAALDAGLAAILLEQDEAALQRGRERITDHYRQRVAAGKLDAARASAAESRLATTMDWSALAAADLVIEAVFEDMAVKQEVLRRIDAHARPGAVLATNTSYLDIDAIAEATARPQDVLGLHFFSPAHVMKLHAARARRPTCWPPATRSARRCASFRYCVATASASSATASTTPTAPNASSCSRTARGRETSTARSRDSGWRWARSRWRTCRGWTSPGACAARAPRRATRASGTSRSSTGSASVAGLAARQAAATTRMSTADRSGRPTTRCAP